MLSLVILYIPLLFVDVFHIKNEKRVCPKKIKKLIKGPKEIRSKRYEI